MTPSSGASTAHNESAADRQEYEKFLDDARGALPEINPFGDLDNEIHPTFRKGIFHKQTVKHGITALEVISDAAYTAMVPAFRLASLLITQRSMFPVFDHIANSSPTKDDNGAVYMAIGPWENTQHGYDFVQAVFDFMASDVLFAFSSDFSREESSLEGTILASTRLLSGGKSKEATTQVTCFINEHGQQIKRRVLQCTSIIRFRAFFLEYFETGVQQDMKRGKMNALFCLVEVLMHEVTHASGYHVENFLTRLHLSIEPGWSLENPMQEFGWAYEAWFFQGTPPQDVMMLHKLLTADTIFPIDALLHAPIFVPIAKPNTIILARTRKHSNSGYVFRVKDMRKWCLKSTWQDLETGKDSHANIMTLAKCAKVDMEDPHLVVSMEVEVVVKFDRGALWLKGWLTGYPHGSVLSEGFWDETCFQEASSRKA